MNDKIPCEDLVPGYIYVTKKATKRALFIGHVSTINLTPLVLHPDLKNEKEEVIREHLRTGHRCVPLRTLKDVPRELLKNVCVKQSNITYGMFFLDLDQMDWIFKGKNIEKKSIVECLQTNITPRLERQSMYFIHSNFNLREKATFSKIAIDHKFEIPKNFIENFAVKAVERLNEADSLKVVLERLSKMVIKHHPELVGYHTYKTVKRACDLSKYVNMVYLGVPTKLDPNLDFLKPYIVQPN